MKALLLAALAALLLAFPLVSMAQDAPGRFPFTSSRDLTPADMEGKELADLKIMRNEVFARHGHTFKGEDLKKHFSGQSWYKATVADATPMLTPLEKKNVTFIRQWENRMATTADFDNFYAQFTQAVKANDIDKLSDLVLIDFIESMDKFKDSYNMHKADIREAIESGEPTGSGDTRSLKYGEFYNGVQYRMVQFKKQGCCWYVYAFLAAG